jgi:hypothetical protein
VAKPEFKAYLVLIAPKEFSAFDVSSGTVVEWSDSGAVKPVVVVSTEERMRKLTLEEISAALKSAKTSIEAIKASEQCQQAEVVN